MLSRSAERLYWLARYLERTENIARLVSVHMNLLMDLSNGVEMGWLQLVPMPQSSNSMKNIKLPTNAISFDFF